MKFKSLCLGLLAFASALAFANDPAWRYSVVSSPHFELIYREGQKDLATRYILAAEQAHALLIPIFKELPEKTTIVLMDNTDGANGMATFLPYPHIVVFPVLPSTLDSIDEYSDWALEMMIHEYTHILNMHPAHGIYEPFKYIFGSVVRPNAVLPRWYLEGLAVNLESRLTSGGRLRSSETQGAARMLALHKGFSKEDIARVNESSILTWPQGGRPYLYGGWWWDHVHREKGAPVIETWNQNFARRLPFFVNGPLREQTGRSAGELFTDMARAQEHAAQTQLEAIRTAKAHSSVAVSSEIGEQSVFAVSPSGHKLVYFTGRPGLGSWVRLKTRSDASQSFAQVKSERLFKTVGSLRVRWIDDDRFVFDQMVINHPRLTYRDLFMYSLGERRQHRLTEGARAQDASASPDGRALAFIQNDGGKNRLAWLDLDKSGAKPRVLVEGNYHQRLSSPEFLNAHELAYVLRVSGGEERVYLYDLRTQRSQPYPVNLTSTQHLRQTHAGLLVTDAGTRARNVFLLAPGRAPQAVSNTLTDIQVADYDPHRKELLVSELWPEGRRLRAVPWANFQPPTLPPPAVGEPPPAPPTESIPLKDEAYQPLSYLYPRYWIPFIFQVEEGLLFQGLTSNNDPVGRHRYSLMGGYDTVTNKGSYGVGYVNSTTPTDIGLSYARQITYLGASGLIVQSQLAAVNFSQFWPFNDRNLRWSAGGVWTEAERNVTRRRIGPEASIQYSRLQNPLNQWLGVHAELSHQEYLAQEGYLDYGRTATHLAAEVTPWGDHRITVNTRAALAPRQPVNTILDLGDRNVGGPFLINLANSQYMLRGYPSGTFIGRKLVNANVEYILPAKELGRGFGTFPFFLRNLELALFTDALAVDGAGFNQARLLYTRSGLGEFYVGSGAELRLGSTIAYHLPISFTLGLYYGFNERFGGGFTPFLGIGLGGLGALEDKMP